jgi:CRISPR/Cas system-associated protein Cas7 (RAMP superfamily)
MVCWEMLHRTGNRKRHEIKQLGENMDVDAKSIKSIKSPRVQSQEKVEPVAEMPLYNVIPGDASFGEWIVER